LFGERLSWGSELVVKTFGEGVTKWVLSWPGTEAFCAPSDGSGEKKTRQQEKD